MYMSILHKSILGRWNSLLKSKLSEWWLKINHQFWESATVQKGEKLSLCCHLVKASDCFHLPRDRLPGYVHAVSTSDCPSTGRSCSDNSNGQTWEWSLLLKRFGFAYMMWFQETQTGLDWAILKRVLAFHTAWIYQGLGWEPRWDLSQMLCLSLFVYLDCIKQYKEMVRLDIMF